MNWEAIGAVGQVLGSLAVFITLVYLAMQTYQNTKHTKALIQQGQSGRVVTTLIGLANPELAAAWIAGNGGASTTEAVKALQFAQLCNAVVYDMQDFHNQHVDGLTSDEQFGGACVGYSTLLQQPGFSAYWKTWSDARARKCPTFIAWANSLVSDGATAGRDSHWI